ncbi:unnamed protein product [Owenia fusiformis]|uniref:Uncharacterized protein n=1 Tax=Owenia fusiformis TaxID=6347 RepID=A0A8S4N184_OWEFU|nr:unnamed protein product [Owenia fusiformis]
MSSEVSKRHILILIIVTLLCNSMVFSNQQSITFSGYRRITHTSYRDNILYEFKHVSVDLRHLLFGCATKCGVDPSCRYFKTEKASTEETGCFIGSPCTKGRTVYNNSNNLDQIEHSMRKDEKTYEKILAPTGQWYGYVYHKDEITKDVTDILPYGYFIFYRDVILKHGYITRWRVYDMNTRSDVIYIYVWGKRNNIFYQKKKIELPRKIGADYEILFCGDDRIAVGPFDKIAIGLQNTTEVLIIPAGKNRTFNYDLYEDWNEYTTELSENATIKIALPIAFQMEVFVEET